ENLGQAATDGDSARLQALEANINEQNLQGAEAAAASAPAAGPQPDAGQAAQSNSESPNSQPGPGEAPRDGESGTDRKEIAENLKTIHSIWDDAAFAAEAYGSQRLTSTIQITRSGSFLGIVDEGG